MELILLIVGVVFLCIAIISMLLETSTVSLLFGGLAAFMITMSLAAPGDLTGGGDFGYMFLSGFMTVVLLSTFAWKVTRKKKAES